MSMRSARTAGGLVYSTDAGRMCPVCRQAVAACSCQANKRPPAGDGIVRVSRQSKGRGGKTVTLVTGLCLADAELGALAKQLRSACGAGGTVKDGVIEVQGDHIDTLLAALLKQGHPAKKAGA